MSAEPEPKFQALATLSKKVFGFGCSHPKLLGLRLHLGQGSAT